jgi:O-antigen/teichoic acid export membrane protein
LFSLLLLIAVYYDILTVEGFVYATAGLYFWLLVTMFYAFSIQNPLFSLSYQQIQKILTYTFYIILSGSVANLLLDGDKIMLNQYMVINIAFR